MRYPQLNLRATITAALPFLVACSGGAVAPENAGTGSGCVSDISCPLGEECGAGVCEPVATSIYPHIQTASLLFRPYLDAAEVAWRASHYDVLIGNLFYVVDDVRAVNPNARLFEYVNIRYNRYDEFGNQATEWALAHGENPEDFYLHYREDVDVPTWEGTLLVEGFPAGVVPGWNPGAGPGDPPANAVSRDQARAPGYNAGGGTGEVWKLANVTGDGFRRFLAEWLPTVLTGESEDVSFSGGPMDGVVLDNAIYYPQFGEGVLDKTDEFYGIPLDDAHPYADGFATIYPELSEALARHFGHAVDLMPNFGHVSFLVYNNPASQSVVATTPWIWAQVWLRYFGTSSPTTGSNRVITYDADYAKGLLSVIHQTRGSGRRVIGAQDLSNSSWGSDRGRLFTLALYYLVHNVNTFYNYETTTVQSDLHMSQWQWNPAVEFDVGTPDHVPPGKTDFEGHYPSTEHYVFAEGADPYRPDLTYRVLARRFTNALVLARMLPAGSVVNDLSATVHALDGSYAVLNADGTLGEVVTSVTIRNNEGFILIPVD
jgi:hypothetical protein